MSESPFTKTEPQLNIGLLGYGTVGRTVAELLDERDCGIRIRHILRRPGHADGPLMTDSFEAVLNDPEVTCIVEALPGRDPALSYIRAALAAGKHVVTSNKAAVAADLKGLAELARANNVSLLFEASCGGGMHWVEMIKKKIGSAFPGSEVMEIEVKGRNIAEGVPRTFTVHSNEILEALSEPLNQIVVAVKNALEKTPPELGADIAEHGLMLTGGGALLRDLDQLLKEETGLPVHVAEEPLNCVVKGCGIALENMDKLRTAFAAG